MVKRKKINSKKLIIKCGHPVPIKPLNNFGIHSRCSHVAYSGCHFCILKYLYTVYKRPPDDIEKAKKFVTECVCWSGSDRPIDEVYKTLKFCYSIGLTFGMEVFEFERRFSRKQIIWLLKHDTPHYMLDIKDLILKEYWDIINLVAVKDIRMKEMPETITHLILPTSIVAIVLLFLYSAK